MDGARATAAIALLLASLTGCREVPRQGRLTFPPETADLGGAPAAGAAPAADGELALRPPQDAPWGLRVTFRVQSPTAQRTEAVLLQRCSPEQGRRVQTIHFEAPGEAPVDRLIDDRLEDGEHLRLGPAATFWRHPGLEVWREAEHGDLTGFRGLLEALRLEPGPPQAATDPAGQPGQREHLEGPNGAHGELWFAADGQTLRGVQVEVERPDLHLNYAARLLAGPELEAPPAAPAAEALRSPDRLRSLHRIEQELAPFLPKGALRPAGAPKP